MTIYLFIIIHLNDSFDSPNVMFKKHDIRMVGMQGVEFPSHRLNGGIVLSRELSGVNIPHSRS